jgi:hypothetical protein
MQHGGFVRVDGLAMITRCQMSLSSCSIWKPLPDTAFPADHPLSGNRYQMAFHQQLPLEEETEQ